MAPRRKSKKNARAGASTSKKRASGACSPVPPARSSTPVPPATVAATAPATVVVENTEETRLISLPLLNTSPNLPARFRKTKYLLSPWVPGTPLPERSGTIYNRRASLEETHNLPTEKGTSSISSTSPIASTPQVSGPSIGPSGVEDNSESPNQGPLSTMVNGPPERNEAHDDFNPSEETISALTPGRIPRGDVSSDPLISPLVSTNAANLSCPCKRWKPTPLIGPGHPGPNPIYCNACRTWSEAYEGGI